MAVHNK